MSNQDKSENGTAMWVFGLLVSNGLALLVGWSIGLLAQNLFHPKTEHPIASLHTFIPHYRILTNSDSYGLECQIPIHPEGGDKWHKLQWTSKERDAAIAEIASRTRLVVEMWPSTLKVFEIESSKKESK